MTPWASLHVFSAADLDILLVDGIRPAVERLRAEGACRRWFYIRYWNGGPHLRVRLEPGAVSEARLAAAARDEFEAFLTSRPVTPHQDPDAYRRTARQMHRTLAAAVRDGAAAGPEPVEPLQPSGSVQRRSYHYESSRYGGEPARELTEGHFCRSSHLAATIVAHSLSRPDARLSLAVSLLATLPVALGLAPRAAEELLVAAGGMAHYLRPDVLHGAEAEAPPLSGLVPLEEQRPDVAAVVRRARTRPAADPSSLAEVARELWQRELDVCAAALSRLWADGQLGCHPHQVLLSYSHMLVNRLGVGFAEECHVYRMLAQAQGEWATKKGDP